MAPDLESRIASLPATNPTASDVENLAIQVARLSKSLSEASSSLPTYDQRLYATQVKSLEQQIDSLRNASKPKSRFAFKRKPLAETKAPPPVQSPSSGLGNPVPSLDPETLEGYKAKGPTKLSEHDSAALSQGLELAKRDNCYLTWTDLPTRVSSGSAPDLAISNLSRCIVNLLPTKDNPGATFSALHIRDLSDCIVMLPFNEGSALIHDVSNCVFALGCHQFRMHTSTKVDVYLKISSNPIIETCNDIRFATYPSRLAPQLLQEPPQAPFTVQDFSHIRATPSPNFALIGGKLGIDSKPWPTERISDPNELSNSLVPLLPETAADGAA